MHKTFTGTITKGYNPLVFSTVSPAVQGVQQSIEEWDTALSLDPIDRDAGPVSKVLGLPNSPFQLRLVQKFFFDYPSRARRSPRRR